MEVVAQSHPNPHFSSPLPHLLSLSHIMGYGIRGGIVEVVFEW